MPRLALRRYREVHTRRKGRNLRNLHAGTHQLSKQCVSNQELMNADCDSLVNLTMALNETNKWYGPYLECIWTFL